MKENKNITFPNVYKGTEPYIFMSYAHKNAEEVMKILLRIQQRGYRMWYDGGIDPGVEWDQNIASHIDACAYFIAFISDEYIASSNCKDELNYARDKEKPRLLIYLHNTELPSGMSMRMNRLQAIHKYTYPDENMFYEKVFDADGLAPCLAEDVTHTAEEVSVGAGMAPGSIPANGASAANTAQAGNTASAVNPAQAAPGIGKPKKEKARSKAAGGGLKNFIAQNRNLVIGAGAALAVILLGVIGLGIISSNVQKKNASKPDEAVEQTSTVKEEKSEQTDKNDQSSQSDKTQYLEVKGFDLEWGMTKSDLKSRNSGKKFAQVVSNDGTGYLKCDGNIPFSWGNLDAYRLILFFDGKDGGLSGYSWMFKGKCKEEIYAGLPEEFKKSVVEPAAGQVYCDLEGGKYNMVVAEHMFEAMQVTQCNISLVEEPAYFDDTPVKMELAYGTAEDDFISKYGDYEEKEVNDIMKETDYTYYKNILIGDHTAHTLTVRFEEGELAGYYYGVAGNEFEDVCKKMKYKYGDPNYENSACMKWTSKQTDAGYIEISLGRSGKYNGISTIFQYTR